MSTKKNKESKKTGDVVDAVCDTVELHYRDLHRCLIAVAATGGDNMSTASRLRFVGFGEGKLRAKSAQEKKHAVAEMQANACGLLHIVLLLCDEIAESGVCMFGAQYGETFASVCAAGASAGVKRFRVVAVDEAKEANA